MSLRFVYGRAGSGKTYFCLNELKTKIAGEIKTPLVFLVPEQFTFQAERDLVTLLKTGGILQNEVLSFRRMAFRIFNEAGGITYPHIHPAGKSMILYRILDKMQGSLNYFAKSANQPGFVDTLSTLITEFKHCNVTPGLLEGAGSALEEDNPLKNKLGELAGIYAAFEKLIEQRYRDAEDDLTLAAEKMKSSRQYRGAEIWIDGFTDFTPQEYRLIGELLQIARRVTITLTTDTLEGESAGTDIFVSAKTAYRKLIRLATENNIAFEQPVLLNPKPLHRFRHNRELQHLEQNYDAYPHEAYPEPTKAISLFSSVSIFSEIEATARDILRLCRDQGMRFRDIAVVTRNLSGYEKLIEVVFNDYHIPCFMDRKLDIANHPLTRLILSMLEIFTENWSYAAVFRYLKSGMTGIAQDKIDRLENYVLACGIRGNRWTAEQDWNMNPELLADDRSMGNNAALLTEINQTRLEVIAPLMEFRNRTKGRRTAADFCSALFDFLCTMGIPGRIEKQVGDFSLSGDILLANAYSQVWNIVMALLDQTVEVMADETFGVERFRNMLQIGIGEYKIGLIPASLDQVLVGSAERSKSHAIKAMYLLGTNDGIFPAGGGEEGILTDADRDRLNAMGLELAKNTHAKALDENFLVYRTLTTPAEFLRISWPIAEQEGKSLRPSIIISRMRKIFPEILETSNILPPSSDNEVLEQIASRRTAFRLLTGILRQKADGKEILPVWQEVARWFLQRDEWSALFTRVREAFRYSNLAQPVNRELISALYGDPLVSSVSRLERYTACPFSFFVQYGLGARERKIFQLSPPDVGTFLHGAIERFSVLVDGAPENCGEDSGTAVGWRTFDRDWCELKVSEIIDGMLSNMKGSGISSSKRMTALTVRLKRVVSRSVWLIAEHIRRSSFNPINYEAGFGDGEKYPPITLELDSGEKVKLLGRIDRIDALKTADGKYLRIIDYKSGSKDFKLSNVYYGLQLQLITYLDAIWESGTAGGEQVLPGGMLYFKVDDPIIRSEEPIPEEELERAIMKRLRMKGLLLADVKLIREMDHTMEGASVIVPATLNKGDVLGKYSSVATMDQFKLLRKYTRQLLKDLSREILRGSVPINPAKDKTGIACSNCSYLSVCQFDTTMKENAYRVLYEKSNDEVWTLMKD